MKYWKCDYKLSKKIRELWEVERGVVNEMRLMSASVGGSPTQVVTTRSFGCLYLAGFVFDNPPNKKDWYKAKGENFWRARANNPIRQRMDSIQGEFLLDLCILLGLVKDKTELMLCATPGITIKKNTVCLCTVDDFKPIEGLKRISDLQYEALKTE